jgi:hypothetical protein
MQKKNNLPTGIYLSGQNIYFNKIFTKFTKTHYGNTLRANIRFSEFKPDTMSNDVWKKTLGRDVSNLFHLIVSLENTQYFLSLSANPARKWKSSISSEATFTTEEQTSLLFTSVIHDWAEAIIGDIPLTSKQESDEEKEMRILRQMLHEILGSDNDRKTIDKLANEVETILTDKSTKLGKAFNAIERIGYLKTAMKAWYVSRTADEILQKKLKHLATRVVAVHSPKLLGYAQTYPAVHAYLTYRQKPISEIFAQNDKRDEELYKKWLAFASN